MIQDLDQTVKELLNSGGLPAGDSFVPRLCETLFEFGKETVRDLNLPQWRSQFQGGLNAGYILALIGRTEDAVEFLDKGLRIYQENSKGESRSGASVLNFIVWTLEQCDIPDETIAPYRAELEQAREREAEKPEDLHKKIIHIEADLECASGDLDQAIRIARREQGELYHRLGDYQQAITNFRKAIEADPRDWRKETTILNTLLIIDSLLDGGDIEGARTEFMGLMKTLGPESLELGDPLPDLFTSNFSKLHPYLLKLGLEDSMTNIAEHAAARLKEIEPKEHEDRSEIRTLTEILAVHYVGQGEYQKASEVYDAGRAQLEYKHHLSRREQAEFALRAGDPDKAQELITQEDNDRDRMGMDRDEKIFELANLELQLGNIAPALDRLDGYCERYKACLVSGDYSNIYDTRRAQIDILKGAIGEDYLDKVRDHLKNRKDLHLDSMRFLEAPSPDKPQ